VTPEWQQKELIRALERTNAKKEVKKGAAARITPIAIDSTTGPDDTVRKQGCNFVINTELVDVQPVGTGRVGTSVPGAVGTGVTIGKVDEPPDMRRLLHDATVNFQIMRVGDPRAESSGIVTERDTVTEDTLVSRLMNQIASRAASALPSPMSKQERARCIQRLLRIAQIRDIFRDNPPSAALPPNRPSNGETVPKNDLPKARIAA
jgi:hypothetical protein